MKTFQFSDIRGERFDWDCEETDNGFFFIALKQKPPSLSIGNKDVDRQKIQEDKNMTQTFLEC